MTFKFLKNTLIVSAAFTAAAFTTAAHAGQDASNLADWVRGAQTSVDEVMKYPAMAQRRGEEGAASFHVTIDSNGDVIDAKRVGSARSASLNASAMRVVKKADFPAIPASLGKDTMKFSVRLVYAFAGSSFEKRMIERQGTVSGRPIAMNDGPVTASIEILDANEE